MCRKKLYGAFRVPRQHGIHQPTMFGGDIAYLRKGRYRESAIAFRLIEQKASQAQAPWAIAGGHERGVEFLVRLSPFITQPASSPATRSGDRVRR